CFDSDTAGQNAAERSLEALLQNDLVVRVAEMPGQEDPDSLVRKSGRQKFEELVASAPDFFDYWIEKKAATTDLNSLGAKMQVARELAASVTFVRDPVMRGEVMNKISARLAIRLADFETLVKPGQPFRQGDASAATLAREWWNGLRQAILRRELEAAESRLRLPNLTTGEIMQLQKQVLDLRGQLHDVPRFSPARAQQP